MTEQEIVAPCSVASTVGELSAKQQAVLQASLTLFAQKGFANTTTLDIARAAHVAEGTVLKRFKTKEGILRVILTPLEAQILPQATDAFLTDLATHTELSFAELLSYAVANRLSFAMANREALRVMGQEISKHPEILTRLTARLQDLIEQRLDAILNHFRQSGELNDWPTMRIVRSVSGLALGYVMPNIMLSEESLDVEQTTAEIVATLLPAFTGGQA
ncbi:TetR/AcrR family transcriptional regulator [Lacticaseibacillus camelliae]|uniref:TetR family transcriptional regulator n=1 Tax=Lacticaseibacillus camelliae DSM 22697 = JCM 13995 TaxID=1423730 RepID=A0A0R2EQM5_9LACO|nr:TetR/AcrR family transcriptional regulator [Lacticaseibacillus camelliae]KRN18608.1 TetR family transcriptional regulator [Lacticaseibacillus camelliae DSM 22697 = JCM 13995]